MLLMGGRHGPSEKTIVKCTTIKSRATLRDDVFFPRDDSIKADAQGMMSCEPIAVTETQEV